ncbi:unnamed protein product, partial [Phaeothamnion confervicola]
MCRLLCYKGKPIALEVLISRPENSLVYQSRDAGLHPGCENKRNIRVNGDGFGIAWYDRPARDFPCIVKFATPAWSSTNLLELSRFIDAGLLFAHVRAASDGNELTGRVSYENSHPFKVGRYAFMHNGAVATFKDIKRSLLATLQDETYATIEGTTDSELCFAVFLDELGRKAGACPLQRGASAAEMAAALEQTVRRIIAAVATHDERTARASGRAAGRAAGAAGCGSAATAAAAPSAAAPSTSAGTTTPASSLNLCVTDGRSIVATRYRNHPTQQPPSMYYITGESFVCDGEGC